MQESFSDERDPAELSDRLRVAVKTLRERPIPQDSLTRSLALAQGLALRETLAEPAEDEMLRKSKSAGGLNRRWDRRWSRRLIRVAVLLAAAILVAAIVPTAWRATEPQTSWAQVVEAVAARPWIVFREDSEDPNHFEVWCDRGRQRVAFRRAKWLHFANLKKREYEIYDRDGDLLRRAALDSEGLKQEIISNFEILVGLIDAIPGEGDFWSPVERIVAREQRKVVEGGRRWTDFTLKTQRGSSVVLRVDPESRLPVYLFDDPKSAEKARFEYPAVGPEDIYDFGAPRTAKVVDCRPTEQVARIRNDLHNAAEKVGDYVAHVVKLSGGHPIEVERVWRSGRRFRIEHVVPNRPDKHLAGIELPTLPDDESTWAAALDKKLKYEPTHLFDGDSMYQRWNTGLEVPQEWVFFMRFTLAQNGDRMLFRPFVSGVPHSFLFPEIPYICEVLPAQLENNPDDGPAGSVRITSHLTDVFTGSGSYAPCHSKHWFDPAHRNACVKYFRTEADHKRNEKVPVTCCEMDGFRQHSSGVWYPTIVRRCDDDGNVLAGEQAEELRMYWDFDRPVPAEAFARSIEPVRDR